MPCTPLAPGGSGPAGLSADLGAIRRGMLTDITLLDLADPSFIPFNSAARQVVYAKPAARFAR
jgi:5-methylthioadenosine/S-adenosylhomocysteine deaminase